MILKVHMTRPSKKTNIPNPAKLKSPLNSSKGPIHDMKIPAAILALLLPVMSQAAPSITPEFEALLKENHALKQRGEPDPDRIVAATRRIADSGDATAQYLIGLLLLKQDPQKSKEYLLKSSEAGCVGAMTLLGVLYLQEQDGNHGVPLLVKAAENGDATAQVYLSGAYRRGDGFDKSAVQAYLWLKLAERQSFSNGALASIRAAISDIEQQLSAQEKAEAEKQFAVTAQKIAVVDYTFCSQANPDASRSATVPDYLKI